MPRKTMIASSIFLNYCLFYVRVYLQTLLNTIEEFYTQMRKISSVICLIESPCKHIALFLPSKIRGETAAKYNNLSA